MIYQRLEYNPVYRNKIIACCCIRTGYLSGITGPVAIWSGNKSFLFKCKQYSTLECSGIIAICIQVVLYLRPHKPNGSSELNLTSNNLTSNNVTNNSPILINGQLGSDETALVPIFGNNFSVICDKTFTQDDLIRVTFFTPISFIGRGWVGLVPASIIHYNESLNWRRNYAYVWIDSELNHDLFSQWCSELALWLADAQSGFDWRTAPSS